MPASRITFRLNGRLVSVEAPPSKPLLRVLREDFGLTSVKPGCESGECGACTVLLDGKPATSCLVMISQVEGRSVYTLEGLLEDPVMKSLQKAFLEEGALQCGYCTPGFLLAAYALLKNSQKPPSREEILEALSGNICRCGAYPRILRAVAKTAGAKSP